MLNKRFILILLIFSIFIVGLSAASAVDINETNDENQVISIPNDEDNIIAQDNSDEICGDAQSEYKYGDLNCEFKQTGYYYGETKLQLKLTNSTTNNGIANETVKIFVNDKLMKEYTTNSNGLINANFNKMPGKYSLEAKLKDSDLKIGSLKVTISGIPTNIGLSQKGAYYKDAKLQIKLTNLKNNKAMSGEKIQLKFTNGKIVIITTNAKGIATYNIPFKPETYSVTASTISKYIKKNTVTLKKFPIGKTYLKTTAKSISTKYNSGKTLKVKVTNYFTKHVMKNIKVSLKVFTGKKSKTVSLKTDSKGIAKYDVSKLSVGSHKIEIKTGEKYTDYNKKTVTAKISKAKS